MKRGLEHGYGVGCLNKGVSGGGGEMQSLTTITAQCPGLEAKSDLSKVLFKLLVRKAQKVISLLPSP